MGFGKDSSRSGCLQSLLLLPYKYMAVVDVGSKQQENLVEGNCRRSHGRVSTPARFASFPDQHA